MEGQYSAGDENGKIVFDKVEYTVESTVDCTDPAFAKNANCIVYTDQVT